MATFAKPYIYKPTPPRSKSTVTGRKPAPKQVSIFDKLQHIKPNNAADDNRGDRPGIRETGTVYDGSGDNDNDLPTVEEILYTALRKEGFATEDRRPDNTAFGVGAEERGGSLDDNGSALSDNLSGSLEDLIVLLGDDDSSASKAEVDDGGLCAESAPADEGLLNSTETAINSTTPAPPNPNAWHDIDDFPETAPRLRVAEQGASTSDSIHPYGPPSRLSSEPLHDHISAAGQCTVCAKSEPTMSPPARPRHHPPDHLPMDRNAADEHELVRPALNSDIFDEEESQRQEEQEEQEEQEDWGYDNEDGRQLQEEVKEDVAATLMSKKVGDAHLSGKKDESLRLANYDPSLEPSQDKLGSHSSSFSDDELNSNPVSINVDREPRLTKRKRSSLSNNPIYKKRKRHLEQRSTPQRRPHAKLRQNSLKSYSPLNNGLRVTAVSSAKGRLPSPAPSTLQTIDTEIPSDCYNSGRSSSDILPTLTEITFRPHSTRFCSFTAVIRDGRDRRGVSFSQLAQLIESVGYMGKIDDFTIKPIEQHSFLLTGFSRHTSPTVEANHVFDNAPSITLQHNKAIDARALLSEGGEPSSSDDESGLSDSDPDLSDDDACSSKKKPGSSIRTNIPWEPVDEQRLLAYKKEDKSWEWIFKKFPGRTPAAVRTRWTMVQHRVK